MGGGSRLGPVCTAFHLASPCLVCPLLCFAWPASLPGRLAGRPCCACVPACSHAALQCSALLCSAPLCPAAYLGMLCLEFIAGGSPVAGLNSPKMTRPGQSHRDNQLKLWATLVSAGIDIALDLSLIRTHACIRTTRPRPGRLFFHHQVLPHTVPKSPSPSCFFQHPGHGDWPRTQWIGCYSP